MAVQAKARGNREREESRGGSLHPWLPRPASPGPAMGNGEPIHNEPDRRHGRARN
jgi:hypothetical protein